MKFAKRLEDEAMPEWRSEYVSYKKLKKIIKRLQAMDVDVEKGEDSNQRQDNGKDFVDALLTELDKVENFFKTQLDGAIQRKSYLVNQLNDLDAGRDSHVSHVDDHTPSAAATNEATDGKFVCLLHFYS
jgi:SPX domain protein involved in polyphosphate accumulation